MEIDTSTAGIIAAIATGVGTIVGTFGKVLYDRRSQSSKAKSASINDEIRKNKSTLEMELMREAAASEGWQGIADNLQQQLKEKEHDFDEKLKGQATYFQGQINGLLLELRESRSGHIECVERAAALEASNRHLVDENAKLRSDMGQMIEKVGIMQVELAALKNTVQEMQGE